MPGGEKTGKMVFDVVITEVRSKVVQIDALSENEALDQVEKQYLNGEIVLDNEDVEDAKYTILDLYCASVDESNTHLEE